MKLYGTDFTQRSSAATKTAWTELMLLEMEMHAPRMRKECDRRDFWRWLRGEVDSGMRSLSTDEERQAFKLRVDYLVRNQVRNR